MTLITLRRSLVQSSRSYTFYGSLSTVIWYFLLASQLLWAYAFTGSLSIVNSTLANKIRSFFRCPVDNDVTTKRSKKIPRRVTRLGPRSHPYGHDSETQLVPATACPAGTPQSVPDTSGTFRGSV